MYLNYVLTLEYSCILFFFFQAEDGIRDLTVTGVQTCALPIYPGDVGRGHRRPAEHAIGIARCRTEDRRARSAEVDRLAAEVRERRQGVGARRGRHRNDVREIVAGRVERRRVVVRAVVPRGGDEEDPALQKRLDGVEQGL